MEMSNQAMHAMQTLWDYLVVRDEPAKSDVIFVFGSAQIKVPEYAAQLYRDGYAPKVLVSGSNGPSSTKLFGRPEHQVFIEALLAGGVPQTAIISEERATHTGENVSFGMQTLRENGIEPMRIILVAMPHHMRRCVATFRQQEPSVDILACPPFGPLTDYALFSIERHAWRLIGEIERLQIYGSRGDLITQNIPPPVLEACEIIKRLVPETDARKVV